MVSKPKSSPGIDRVDRSIQRFLLVPWFYKKSDRSQLHLLFRGAYFIPYTLCRVGLFYVVGIYQNPPITYHLSRFCVHFEILSCTNSVASTTRWPNNIVVLNQRRRRWPSITATSSQCVVFAGRQYKGDITPNIAWRISNYTSFAVSFNSVM